MSDPVFLSMMTNNEEPYMASSSCAEVVVTIIYHGRQQGWYDLLAFSVLPDELQLVIVPRDLGTTGIIRNIQAETNPLIAALVRPRGPIWDGRFREKTLKSQEALKAQIENVHRTPIILGLSLRPSDYAFCSANPRFSSQLD